uniref:Uncharacterized protein n=1 Tax=Zea mays TaxID=4577 RepID=C4J2V3_MAIZE|nr:unknown [Zea mays]
MKNHTFSDKNQAPTSDSHWGGRGRDWDGGGLKLECHDDFERILV